MDVSGINCSKHHLSFQNGNCIHLLITIRIIIIYIIITIKIIAIHTNYVETGLAMDIIGRCLKLPSASLDILC